MYSRRNSQNSRESTVRPSRVQVPARPIPTLSRPTTSQQLSKPAAESIIPLLDTEKESLKRRSFRRKLPRIPKKVVAALCLLLVAGYIGTHLPKKEPVAVKGTQTPTGPAKLSRDETPKFDTVLPAGKTIAEYGGWTRVSPPDREPVFAYVDKIGNIPINVSQQPLPEELKEDTEDDISQLARDFHAEEKLNVGDTTVHIGTSAKGPQSVIFAKNGLLILIKSPVKVSNDQWTAYVNSLQ